MIILMLGLLGLCFGSFVNALVWRIHMQSKQAHIKLSKKQDQYSISKGRSMCVHCKHTLVTMDLLPVVSWVLLRGKCRYCHKPISWQYPLVEVSTTALFIVSYIFWPYELITVGVVAFGLWLAILVGLVALVVYDIRWMLLPNRIVFFLYFLGMLYVVARVIEIGDVTAFLDYFYGIAIGGGIFYLLFQISKGKWIGGGDVKLGFLLGGLVGAAHLALLMLFIASLLGSIYSLPLLAAKKASRTSRIPFGPFLIVAAIIVVLFGADISDWYAHLVLGSSL